MTLLAILRHGETQWNLERRIQGRTDIPLGDAGRSRLAAHALPAEWRNVRVISSPLARCMETASLLGLDTIEIDDRLVEMGWGEWEGQRLEDLRARMGESMGSNEAKGWDFTPPGGESPRLAFDRVRRLLCEIALAGAPVLAIGHRGVIRPIFAQACGWDMRGRPPARLDWHALQVFELDAFGSPRVHQLNLGLVPKSVDTATA